MFVEGRVYRRREIHEQFGGQRQGGISTPSSLPAIFLFTGRGGTAHGYVDGWTAEGTYLYYGEGQRGGTTVRAKNVSPQ
jgi:5-methylcytosine-specific restriction protein A